MNEKQTHYDWAFGLQWFVAATIGVIVFGMAGFFAMWSVGEVVENSLGAPAGFAAAGALFGGLFALGASLGTGLLLKRKGVNSAKWILYSVACGVVGGAIAFTIILSVSDPESMPEFVAGLLMGATLGVSIGLGQWLAMRSAPVPAGLWPAISLAAFVLALAVALPLGGEGREWIAFGSMGILYGTVSAVGMTWLLRLQTAVAV